MTAKRGRAPVVTARATAEWRFGYRESEYNIAVNECFSRFSPCARGAVDAAGVPRDARDARGRERTGECASRCVAVYATPTRESADGAAAVTRRDHAAATLAVFSRRRPPEQAAERSNSRIDRRRSSIGRAFDPGDANLNLPYAIVCWLRAPVARHVVNVNRRRAERFRFRGRALR